MGEAELDTEQDFSRVGRVNAMLARRLELLAEVEKMARQLGVVSGRAAGVVMAREAGAEGKKGKGSTHGSADAQEKTKNGTDLCD